jgi:hypothetical protein
MTQDATRPAEDASDDDALSDEEEELDDEVQRPFTSFTNSTDQSNATILCDAWRIPTLNELGMPLQKIRGKRSDIWSDDICLVVTEEAVQAAINSGKQFDLSRLACCMICWKENKELAGTCQPSSRKTPMLAYSRGDGTSNMISHMKRNHKAEYDKIVTENKLAENAEKAKDTKKQTSLLPTVVRQKRFLSLSTRKRFQTKCVMMLIKRLDPFHMLKCPHFIDLVQELTECSDFKPPCAQTANKMLDKTYEKVKEKLKKKLKSVMNCELPRISFETDIWTSKNTADSYCALIAHFIDDDFKKHVLLLSVSDFEGKHTSTNMKSWFHEQFLDFGIPSDMKDTATLKKSVFAIVADNESAVQKAVKELDLPSVSCAIHSLNLPLKKYSHGCFREIDLMLAKIKKLAQFTHKSDISRKALQKAAQDLSLDVKRQGKKGGGMTVTIPNSVSTRWESTTNMLARIHYLSAIIRKYWENNDEKFDFTFDRVTVSEHVRLTDDEFELLRQVVAITDQFRLAYRHLEYDKKVTFHMVMLIVFRMRKLLDVTDENKPFKLPKLVEVKHMKEDIESSKKGTRDIFANVDKIHVGDLKDTTRDFMKAVGKDLEQRCDARENTRSQFNGDIHLCGMLFSPKSKLAANSSFMTDDDRKRMMMFTYELLEKIVVKRFDKKCREEDNRRRTQEANDRAPVDSTIPPQAKRLKTSHDDDDDDDDDDDAFSDILDDIDDNESSSRDEEKETLKRRAREELDGYVKHKFDKDDIHLKMDPLDFWKEKGKQWPLVREVAKTILAIPASSAGSERSFSTMGRLLSNNRTTMLHDKVNKLIVLNKHPDLFNQDTLGENVSEEECLQVDEEDSEDEFEHEFDDGWSLIADAA